MLRVGMHFVTLYVTTLRHTTHSGSDAERAEREAARRTPIVPMLRVGTLGARGRTSVRQAWSIASFNSFSSSAL
ncbi:hypothetical protein ALP47_200130 [Pseudomonas savastanoi]|nr:hypothetical protein ALP47_200130 [Pseudomonas savastanoi]